ncbi:ABC-2 family transporter protein [Streptantibioticus parmotrematis]|uniref:ABC transporter permease n=1 Tax=Streptantibioticus parmotrematis TaxID=2873249 RepID=UPI0033E54A59
MWSRSTLTYRVSFLMTVVGNACMTALDFVTIAIIFGHTRTLGGFTLAETAFLYGSSGVAIGLADLLLGSLDGLGRRVRDGTVDALLVRPVPIFAQVAADRFALRRLGRLTQAAVVLVWSLIRLHVAWTPGRALLLPVMAVSGAAIFGAFYTAGAALQFRAGDAAEVQSSFTYGGGTMTQYPPTLFARELVRGAVFVVPVAFVNWMPALWILGRPEPLGLPGWTGWLSPAVALAVCALAGLAWRAGLRSYRSTGS